MSDAAHEGGVREQDPLAVVKIGKTLFAANLIWQSIAPGQTLKEKCATARAATQKPDFFLELTPPATAGTSQEPQVAFGHKAAGHRRAMPSLAAAFAMAHPPDANGNGDDLGMFEVGSDLYYVVASSKGAVIADTDTLFTSFGLAVSEFTELLDRPGHDWRNIYAPDRLGFSQTRDMSVAEAISTRKVPALREFVPVTLFIRLGCAVIAAALVFGAYKLYERHQEHVEHEQALRRSDALMHLREEEAAKARAAAGLWKAKPVFSAALTACVNETNSLPRAVPGWSLTKMTCNGESVKAEYKIDAIGTIAWLYAAFPGVPINWSGQLATVTWTIKGLKTEANEKPFGSLKYLTAWLGSHLQEVFATWAVKDGKPPPKANGPHPAGPSNLYFPSVDVVVKTSNPPVYLLPILSQVPTLVLDNAVYQAKTGEWTVSAHFYGKPTPLKKGTK